MPKKPPLKKEHVRTAAAIQLTTAIELRTAIGIQLKNKEETEVIFKRQVQESVKEMWQVCTQFFIPFFAAYIAYEIHASGRIAFLSCAIVHLHHKILQHAVKLQICVASFLVTSYVVITPMLTYTQHNCRN